MLSDQDKAILDLESSWWRYVAQKDAAIRERFDESPTRYYQRLGELLRNPEAVQYAPLTVSRLLRLEAARRAARTPRRVD